MRMAAWVVIMCGALAVSAPADQWDAGGGDNTSTSTRNELVHGSEQVHDLATLATSPPSRDEDWYLVAQHPLSSYEVVVDSTSARLGGVLEIDRVDTSGAVMEGAQPLGAGFSKSLRWQTPSGLPAETPRVRVRPNTPACNPSCGTDDVYRVRVYETSYGIPRFNNTNGQLTVLVIQNPASYPISGVIYFWSATGAQLGSSPFSLPPKQLLTLSLASLPAVAAASGSVTVVHNGRYGDLTGKAVAIEASTGLTFDTLMVPRPR